jgi:hypothetical protein
LGLGGERNAFLLAVVLLDVLSKVLGIYAILRFRSLLNERFEFHAVDTLIPVLIVTGIIMGAFSYLARVVEAVIPLMAAAVMVGIVSAILGVVFAVRLLQLPGDLRGYLKPLAYTYGAASICMGLVILAPLGLVLFTAGDVILGLILLGADRLEELEVL